MCLVKDGGDTLRYPPAELTFREMDDRNSLEINGLRAGCDISLGGAIRGCAINVRMRRMSQIILVGNDVLRVRF